MQASDVWPLDLSPKRFDRDCDLVLDKVALRSLLGALELDIIDLVDALCCFQSYERIFGRLGWSSFEEEETSSSSLKRLAALRLGSENFRLSPKRLESDWDRVLDNMDLRSLCGFAELDNIDLVDVLCFFQSYANMLGRLAFSSLEDMSSSSRARFGEVRLDSDGILLSPNKLDSD